MKRIGILVADFFEDSELLYPYIRLLEEGHTVDLIGAKANAVYKSKHGAEVKSTVASENAVADHYDALIIPGGYSPDHMRRTPATVELVKAVDKQKKPIAAICHGGWMLASACDLKGRKVTGFFSIKDDLTNAGAEYVDESVVVDGNLITSRTPLDLPDFMKAILKALR